LPCGMPRLVRQIDDLHEASARFLLATWRDLDWQSRSNVEHHAIIDMIERGDVEQSSAHLRSHILAAGHALVDRLSGKGSDS
ncbi:MAG: FCD domain-containing protein, partial [Alphaproteobacteria bacterium]|nr:FCD domain-containing protein [Alphaproteobacteria bacterium]